MLGEAENLLQDLIPDNRIQPSARILQSQTSSSSSLKRWFGLREITIRNTSSYPVDFKHFTGADPPLEGTKTALARKIHKMEITEAPGELRDGDDSFGSAGATIS